MALGSLTAPLAVGLAVFAALSLVAATGIAPTNLLSLVPTLPTPIQHVIVVLFENEPYSAVGADGGYLSSLCGTYSCATSVYSPCHPSEPNYLAAFSDSTNGRCGTDQPVELPGASIATALDTAGRSWLAFAQAMPTSCDTTDNGPGTAYVVHHVPALLFASVTSSASYCNQHVQSLADTTAAAAGAFGFATPPAYTFITPSNTWNQPISASDAWARAAVSAWSAQSWWASTGVLFVYDESAPSDTSCPSGIAGVPVTGCGGHVWLAAVGPYSAGVGAFTTASSTFSVYQTAAWLLGLPSGPTGSAMQGLFSFGTHPPALSVSVSASPDPVDVGATTTIAASASGGVPPYSYAYSALPPGCASANSSTLACTPNVAGSYVSSVTVTDSTASTASATLTLDALPLAGSLMLSPISVTPAAPGPSQPYSLASGATGGTPPYTYTWLQLPPGCAATLATASCATPANGTYATTLRVADSGGATAEASASVTVGGAPPPPPPKTTVSFFGLSEAMLLSLTFSGVVGGGAALAVARRPEWGVPVAVAGLAAFFLL